jgi:hypothetical protein
MTVNLILNPERAARLIEYHARDDAYPGFVEVTDTLANATWKAPRSAGLNSEIRRAVDMIVLQRLMWLASNDQARNQVRAIANSQIESLAKWIGKQIPAISNTDQKAHLQFALSQIKLFQQDPARVKVTSPVQTPAGAPIGSLCSFEP